MMPGVSCEACHGPGEKHVAVMKAGDLKMALIFNPSHLSADELSQEFCGTCHRSVDDVMLLKDQGEINNVRMQPYRLFNSRCYSNDRRIACTACHDPHDNLVSDPDFYDSKCQACHAKPSVPAPAVQSPDMKLKDTLKLKTVTCPVGKKRCVECHMPKVELPGSHFKFADHWIRVNKPGEPFPI